MIEHDPSDDESAEATVHDEDDDAVDAELGDRLRALLGPTDGLDRRTTRDVDSALRARSPLNAAIELFGVGWWTLETIFSDGTRRDDSTGDADERSLMDTWSDADGDLEGT